MKKLSFLLGILIGSIIIPSGSTKLHADMENDPDEHLYQIQMHLNDLQRRNVQYQKIRNIMRIVGAGFLTSSLYYGHPVTCNDCEPSLMYRSMIFPGYWAMETMIKLLI